MRRCFGCRRAAWVDLQLPPIFHESASKILAEFREDQGTMITLFVFWLCRPLWSPRSRCWSVASLPTNLDAGRIHPKSFDKPPIRSLTSRNTASFKPRTLRPEVHGARVRFNGDGVRQGPLCTNLLAEEQDPFCLSMGLGVSSGVTHPSCQPIETASGRTRRTHGFSSNC
jgi:hypothetical protein